MNRNKELLLQLLPLTAQWPPEYEDPGSGLCEYIDKHASSLMPLAGFKRAFWEGGHGQGFFSSYSVFAYWKAGKHHYSKGSFSYAQAAFLYVSHMAPVACLGFGEGRWQKRPMDGAHAVHPSRWGIGERATLAVDPLDGWEELHNSVVSGLARTPISPISIELANSSLPDEIATGYSYFEGLELPKPSLMKDLLFYEGIDWGY